MAPKRAPKRHPHPRGTQEARKVLDGDSESCLSRVRPALASEESWSKGPTWYLAEARAAMAACLLVRGRSGDEAHANKLTGSARTMLDPLFDRVTPLHRRIADVSSLG